MAFLEALGKIHVHRAEILLPLQITITGARLPDHSNVSPKEHGEYHSVTQSTLMNLITSGCNAHINDNVICPLLQLPPN